MNNFKEILTPLAILYGNHGNIHPALIMAQGILESNSGKSELAINANNLFGIKKGTGWMGETYAKSSKEWSQERGWYDAVSEFRKYETIAESVADLVEFYHRPRYAQVVGEPDLYKAAQAAWAAGYATDPTYPDKIMGVALSNGLLEGYELAKKKVAVSAGHGGFGVTPGKRGPDGKVEWEWNNQVALAFIQHLTTTFDNVEVIRVDDPTGRTDTPLATRVARANNAGADVYVSFHHNAMGSTWRSTELGVETFRMQGLSTTSAAGRLQAAIHPRVVKAMGLKDRGAKAANFQELRTTKMPAVLIEGGFMDSRVDRAKMDNPVYTNAQGVAASEGTGAFLSLKRKPTQVVNPTPAPKWFRLRTTWADAKGQAAAFLDLNEAKAAADKLKGYKVYDVSGAMVYDPAAPQLYRVRKSWSNAESQLGAFADKAAALDLALKNAGYAVYDSKGNPVPFPEVPKPAPPPIVAPPVVKPATPPKGGDNLNEVHVTLREEFAEAQKLGITDGTDPNGNATRVQVAVMIVRAVRLVLKALGKESTMDEMLK